MAGGEKEGKEGGKDELEYGISRWLVQLSQLCLPNLDSYSLHFQVNLSGCSASWWTPGSATGGWGSKGTGNRKKSNWKWLELGCVLEELSTLPASLLALKKGKQRRRVQIDGH